MPEPKIWKGRSRSASFIFPFSRRVRRRFKKSREVNNLNCRGDVFERRVGANDITAYNTSGSPEIIGNTSSLKRLERVLDLDNRTKIKRCALCPDYLGEIAERKYVLYCVDRLKASERKRNPRRGSDTRLWRRATLLTSKHCKGRGDSFGSISDRRFLTNNGNS